MKAWWFEPKDGFLAHESERRKPKVGVTHTVPGPLVLCMRGLHASVFPLDALSYAKSPNIWRVALSGEINRGENKCCATERTYLWRLDASQVLGAFARKCALDVIHLWDPPDVVIKFLRTGDETLRVQAAGFAEAEAGSPAGLMSGQRNASWAAARAAAAAAWCTPWASARDAADVARTAITNSKKYKGRSNAEWKMENLRAWDKQDSRLRRMLMEAKP
jgi:hypothetical protein